nr:TPA_inf: conotoxin precursor O2 [Conus ebraeus]
MSTQALIHGDGENRPKEKIKSLSKRKSVIQQWWDGDCTGWSNGCQWPSECCSGECIGYYCDLW